MHRGSLLLLLPLLASVPAAAAFAKRSGSRRSGRGKPPASRAAKGFGTPTTAKLPDAVPSTPPPPPAASPLLADPGALRDAGMALMEAGRYEEAGLALEQVIDTAPDDAGAWSALGVCMASLGQPEAALACQKQVVALRRALMFIADDALPPLPDGRRLAIRTGETSEAGTGGQLYPAAVELCRHLAIGHGRTALPGGARQVLEIGCGTGAVGLFAAALGARRVALTDGGPPAVLALARANSEANRALWGGPEEDEAAAAAGAAAEEEARVEVLAYSWGAAAPPELRGFDLVVGSDVTYDTASHAALCACLAAQARPWSPSGGVLTTCPLARYSIPTFLCLLPDLLTWCVLLACSCASTPPAAASCSPTSTAARWRAAARRAAARWAAARRAAARKVHKARRRRQRRMQRCSTSWRRRRRRDWRCAVGVPLAVRDRSRSSMSRLRLLLETLRERG